MAMPTERFVLDGLTPHLVLHPPTAPEKAPAAVQFERFREIEIEWAELIVDPPDESAARDDDVAVVRDAFELGWLTAGEDPSKVKDGKDALWTLEACHRLGHEDAPVSVPSALQLIELPSGRRFLVLDGKGNPVADDPSSAKNDAEALQILWGKLEDVEQVGAGADDVNKCLPSMDYVSREPMVFRDEFQRLEAELAFAKKAKQVADDQLHIGEEDQKTEGLEHWWRDKQARDSDQRRYAELAVEPAAVKERIRALADRVARAGYTLALEDNDKAGDEKISRGDIYTLTKRMVRWTSLHLRFRTVVKRGSCGKKRILRIPFPVVRRNVRTEIKPRKISFTVDPVREEIERLANGKKRVFEVVRTAEGLRTQDGERLAAILDECWRNESFRTNCVVVVPDYAPLVSGASQYLGAAFYHNPLPPRRPTRFPRLALREQLSYTTMWRNAELGQIVGSINLAPGEERNVRVSRTFEQEVKDTSSFSSTSELSSSRSLDLSTAIENEATTEFAKNKSFSGSVSGGFKLGPFGAKAAAETNRSTSLRNFSRSMTKVARKAVQSLNRKMVQNVSATTSTTTRVKVDSDREIALRNINQGRALNLLLYQINNHFIGGTYLDGLELSVAPGAEVIAGSGLFDTYFYRLDQLDQVLEHFLPSRVPLQIPLQHSEDRERPSGAYWNRLLDQLLATLEREYMVTETPQGERHANCETSVGCLDMDIPPCILTSDADGTEESFVDESQLATLKALPLTALVDRSGEDDLKDPNSDAHAGLRLERVRELLEGAILRPVPLEPDELIVASGGLYLDSLVGARPSTEPYAESMRELEREKLAAEVEHQRSRTRSLFGSEPELRIVGVEVQRRDGVPTVRLRFDPALPHERWNVLHRGRILPTSGSLELDPVDGSGASVPWPVGWRNVGSERLKDSLHLEEIGGSRRVFFVHSDED